MSEQAPALEQRRSIDPLQAFRQAITFRHQGRLWEVEQFYEIVLKADERHFDAVYRFGLIRPQQGRFADATHLFRRAVKVDKNSADAQFHLAVALTGLERHEDAVSRYEKALAIRASFPEAHNNLGHESWCEWKRPMSMLAATDIVGRADFGVPSLPDLCRPPADRWCRRSFELSERS